MVVPEKVSPVDYLLSSNEYVFLMNDFTLKVNYTTKMFELISNHKISFTEPFSLVETPEEWFEIIDFGIVDWIRLAINWKMDFEFTFKLEKQQYYIAHNSNNNELLLQMENRTISKARDELTTDYPELQYWEGGKLLTKITDFVLDELCNKLDYVLSDNQIKQKPFATQIGYTFKQLAINQNFYKIGYSKEFDRILLFVPKLSLYGNLLHIEKDMPWISEMHSGAMYDIIRDVLRNFSN